MKEEYTKMEKRHLVRDTLKGLLSDSPQDVASLTKAVNQLLEASYQRVTHTRIYNTLLYLKRRDQAESVPLKGSRGWIRKTPPPT